VRNERSKGAEALARSIIEDDRYQGKLLVRAQTGDLAPAVEAMLWAYAFGKPMEPARDEEAFIQNLVNVVLKYASNPEAHAEIRALLEGEDNPTTLRAVA
jgi:hypothetical protein